MKRLFAAAALVLTVSPAFAASTDTAALNTLLDRSNAAYAKVNDYEAVFRKTERKKDSTKMGSTENIFFKFEKPFKLFMGWMEGKKSGLQVFYERGKNNNNLAVHVPGALFKLKPVIFLDQSSPWVQEGGSTTHGVEDAGIGTFLKDFTTAVRRGAEEQKLEVTMSPDGRTADVTFPNTIRNTDYFAYRIIVTFDSNDLPVAMELYDWKNKMKGKYSYDELKLNVGPGGQGLDKHMHGALKPVYLQNNPYFPSATLNAERAARLLVEPTCRTDQE